MGVSSFTTDKSLPNNMGYVKSIELRDRGGDLSKEWHIELSFFDVTTTKYKRIRISDEINTYKKVGDRRKFAVKLIAALKVMIGEGWNPITKEYYVEEEVVDGPNNLNCIWLIVLFLKEKAATVNPSTYESYNVCLSRFKKWLAENGLGQLAVYEITGSHIRNYLLEMKEKRGWNNKTYNNYFTYIRTFFIYAQSLHPTKLLILPTKGIKKLRVETKGNLAFNDKTFKLVTEEISKEYPYLLKFVQAIYYTCLRPQAELRMLRCSHIDFDRNLIRVPGHIDKNNNPEFIPIDPKFREILNEMGADKANGDYYLFSKSEKPGPEPLSEDYTQERFKKVKTRLGISQDHTLYAFKHTRGIHLYEDTKDPIFIMKLFRHKDLETTMIYLRSLGCSMDVENFKVSRSF